MKLLLMRILIIHNEYNTMGGEDSVFNQETSLLRQNGHEVFIYLRSNKEILSAGLFRRILMPLTMIWSLKTLKELKKIIEVHKPEVAHFHNTFFMISPSAYFICKKHGIPTIQSIHNPRWFCIAASFYRDSHICLKCKSMFVPWPGIILKCYRNSRTYSLFVVLMLLSHKILNTWHKCISQYVSFSQFYKTLLIEQGFEEKKIYIKPHFISPDPSLCNIGSFNSSCALFVGRFDQQKGIMTLLKAWTKTKEASLRIYGGGILQNKVNEFITENNLTGIQQFGFVQKSQIFEAMKKAQFLIFPSEWYETFGLTIIEAFACGIPVIASRLGVITEIIKEKETGLFFEPGNSADLAEKVQWAFSNKEEMIKMGENARKEYLIKYTPEINYEMMLEIYSKATSTLLL